jgi:hypothetical protein
LTQTEDKLQGTTIKKSVQSSPKDYPLSRGDIITDSCARMVHAMTSGNGNNLKIENLFKVIFLRCNVPAWDKTKIAVYILLYTVTSNLIGT